MADIPAATPSPGIAALPLITARQIGSGQVLVGPISVVKELIDNALDARAKSIFVDITANTIDSIQVKDDGHGIPAEDRALVCRRYCTSKIRDFHDLKEVGGRWLGFRGEALSSMAEISGTLFVTTRVEGEPVAVKLKYDRDGELASAERDSHPVGTTVKAAHFFEFIPVRKQTAAKNSVKCLAKIRRLMQAYALARPAVRFRLHVLKANNNKSDFMYAPKASSNVEDAVLKVIGKDCALQCDWTTLESNGFEIHAFLPKPTANGPKIANHGAFVSIDSRPVSNNRGITKQVVSAFKERLRKSNLSLANVKNPFFCMNIICPPDSYDLNIEPAKDDVMFDNREVVMGTVDKLLSSCYPEATAAREYIEPMTSAQQPQVSATEDLPARSQTPILVYEDPASVRDVELMSELRSDQPRWRSSMYGVDEDDLEYLQENQLPVIEEEEGSYSAAVSNPWTIARMNATVKPRNPTAQGQLLSPARSNENETIQPSSPTPLATPNSRSSTQPWTPQTPSRMNVVRSSLDNEFKLSNPHLPQRISEEMPATNTHGSAPLKNDRREVSLPLSEAAYLSSLQRNVGHTNGVSAKPSERSFLGSPSFKAPKLQSHVPQLTSPASSRDQPQQTRKSGRPIACSVEGSNDTWFGQPMRGSDASRSSHRSGCKEYDIPLFASDSTSTPRRPVVNAAEGQVDNRPYSENNTDIRNFFGQNAGHRTNQVSRAVLSQSFNIITDSSKSSQSRRQLSILAVDEDHRSLGHNQHAHSLNNYSRGSSTEPHSRSRQTENHLLVNSNIKNGSQPRSMMDQLRAYAERELPSFQPLSSRAASSELSSRSLHVQDALRMYTDSDGGTLPRNSSSQFQAYETAYSKSPMPRPASAGSERPSLIPKRSQEVKTAPDLYCHGKLSNNARDMAAHFKAYQARELASPNRAQSLIRRQNPHIVPPHETAHKARPQRRRTTDGSSRTKSSNLPLERVPHGYHIQDLVLLLQTSITSIVQSSHKLDMGRNSLEWDYSTYDTYNTFVESVTERKVMDWVIKLDNVLHEHCERMPDVDTRSLLHEAIQRSLDARKVDQAMETIEVVEVQGAKRDDNAIRKVDDDIPSISQHVTQPTPKAEDEISEFYMSQFVDFDVAEIDDDEAPSEEAIKEADDNFGDDIEDDMLLDL